MTDTNTNELAIVVVSGTPVDRIIGPFANGDEATRYGFAHFDETINWYWLPLEAPDTQIDAPKTRIAREWAEQHGVPVLDIKELRYDR